MTLAEWLHKNHWTNGRLAENLGVSEECARLYRGGFRRPGAAITQRIITLTSGAVTQAALQRAYDDRQKGISPYGQLDRIRRR